jgi:hypothetical protein
MPEAADNEAEPASRDQAATFLPALEFDRLVELLDERGQPLQWARKVMAKRRYRRT